MTDSGTSTKGKWLALGAVAVIAASAVWIYRTQFGLPEVNLQLHQAVGHVMAEETSGLIGHLGKVVIVTVETRDLPELKVQVDAFQKHLKELGAISVKDKLTLDPGENPKYRPGSGLSAKHFLKIVRKNAGTDVIVSFIGAPQLTDAEIAQMKAVPKFIAETHSPEKLTNLFQKKVLLVAVVPRYEFPAPGPRKPQTSRQWFDHYFQVVTATTTVPTEDATP